MKVLIIGGGGKVGSIARPAIEAAHEVTHLDLKPVRDWKGNMIVGSVADDEVVAKAVKGQDAVIFMAMGTINGELRTCGWTDPAFNCNVRDQYRVLKSGLEQGVRKFILISSLSVIVRKDRTKIYNEDSVANAFDPYGLSKILAEKIHEVAAMEYPDATLLCLRFQLPRTEAEFIDGAVEGRFDPAKGTDNNCATGPKDIQRLMLASLELNKPGCHIVQTTGDMTGIRLPNDRATALLGWAPRNE